MLSVEFLRVFLFHEDKHSFSSLFERLDPKDTFDPNRNDLILREFLRTFFRLRHDEIRCPRDFVDRR